MIEFEKFTFESFDFDKKNLIAKFYYSFDNGLHIFEEIIDFKKPNFLINKENLDNQVILNNFLFNLHIALGISYYKLFPTKILEVKSGYLSEEQIIFWKKFYRNGLAEFFIKNDIDFSGLINFKNIGKVPDLENVDKINNYINNNLKNNNKNLLLWGGGKDSITSLILLEEKELDLFVFGKIDKIKENTARIAQKEILLVKRQLSNNLFKLNQAGYYNGHVPITGIIAFVTFIVSYLYGYKNIILSNEKSASEENTTWKGLKINHQYSKSLEFEQDLNNYLHNFISKNINYYSLLRDKYEYEIAEIFAKKASIFFNSFSSCNRNFKINGKLQDKLWCCECEKCCFVFLILSAHLEQNELINIFGENLFDNLKLENTFKELIGLKNYKPFECVGTYDESLKAIKKAIEKNFSGKVLENIKQEIL